MLLDIGLPAVFLFAWREEEEEDKEEGEAEEEEAEEEETEEEEEQEEDEEEDALRPPLNYLPGRAPPLDYCEQIICLDTLACLEHFCAKLDSL